AFERAVPSPGGSLRVLRRVTAPRSVASCLVWSSDINLDVELIERVGEFHNAADPARRVDEAERRAEAAALVGDIAKCAESGRIAEGDLAEVEHDDRASVSAVASEGFVESGVQGAGRVQIELAAEEDEGAVGP